MGFKQLKSKVKSKLTFGLSHPGAPDSTSPDRISSAPISSGSAPQCEASRSSQVHDKPATKNTQSESSVEPDANKDEPPAEDVTGGAQLSPSQRVWNEAYNDLKEDKETAKLVDLYLEVLMTQLGDVPMSPEVDGEPEGTKSPFLREEIMSRLLRGGQEKIATMAKIGQWTSDASGFLTSAKSIVDLAVQNIPQAALPWAGVCIGLQILVQPLNQTTSNLKGIEYIIKRMEWYCALTDSLLNAKGGAGEDQPCKLKSQLESRIIALYKAVLIYQMKSACWYYRSRAAIVMRGFIKVDDWDAELKNVTDVENILKQDIIHFSQEDSRIATKGLLSEAKDLKIGVMGFEQKFSDFIHSRMQDDVARCMSDLFLVDPRQSLEALERKKGGLLQESSDWILDTSAYTTFKDWANDSSRLLWIKGSAGTGKTMLLIHIIKTSLGQLSEISPRVAYFFFQGTGDTSMNATAKAAFRSLIWMVLVQQPELLVHLQAAVKYKSIRSLTGEQELQFLSGLFKEILADEKFQPTYLIVDALDECKEGLVTIRDLIQDSVSISKRVRWLVSSRSNVALDENSFQSVSIEPDKLEKPLETFIEHKVTALTGFPGYNERILGELSDLMHQNAGNTFLWVALAFLELEKVDESLNRPLGGDALGIIKQIPKDLQELYKHMMAKIERSSDGDQNRSKNILSAMYLAQRPLSLLELKVLAGLDKGEELSTVALIVSRCGSYLVVLDQEVSFIHQTAKDYLADFYVSKIQPLGLSRGHESLVNRSIEAMSEGLIRNPYKLSYDSEANPSEIRDPDPLSSFKYSATFWVHHLCEAALFNAESSVLKETLEFLEKHFLVWLESLSLLRYVYHGLASIRRLLEVIQRQAYYDRQSLLDESRAEAKDSTRLVDLLKDAERFVSLNASTIAQFPRQIYSSALLSSPQTSTVRQLQWEKKPSAIEDISGIAETWGARRYHLDRITSGNAPDSHAVAFSPDGNLLAAASEGASIRLFATATGMCTNILLGHSKPVDSVKFSANSELLVSTSEHEDKVILWTVATGNCKKTLNHKSVQFADFSHSGKLIASVSRDDIVIWDMQSGAARHIQEERPEIVSKMLYPGFIFSPDDQSIATLCNLNDWPAQIWDTCSGALKYTINLGTQESRLTARLWPDGKIYVRFFERIQIWELKNDGHKKIVDLSLKDDSRSTQTPSNSTVLKSVICDVHPLQQALDNASKEMLRNFPRALLSPKGNTLAMFREDTEIHLWDMTKSARLQSLQESHVSSSSAIDFSPDGRFLATSSHGEVILWDASINASSKASTNQQRSSGEVRIIVFSHSGQLVAIAADGQSQTDSNERIELWNTETCSLVQTLNEVDLRCLGPSSHLSFTPDDKTLVSVHRSTQSIQFWDCETGQTLQLLDIDFEVERSSETHAKFSSDGKFLARVNKISNRKEFAIQLYSTATRALDWKYLSDQGKILDLLAFSPEGKLLAIPHRNNVIEIFDVREGDLKICQQFESQLESWESLAVASDGVTMACSFKERDMIGLWNIQGGTLIRVVDIELPASGLSFSENDHFIDLGIGRKCIIEAHKNCDQEPNGSASMSLSDGLWLVQDWEKIMLWPPAHEISQGASHKGTLVLGHRSGQVIFVKTKRHL